MYSNHKCDKNCTYVEWFGTWRNNEYTSQYIIFHRYFKGQKSVDDFNSSPFWGENLK